MDGSGGSQPGAQSRVQRKLEAPVWLLLLQQTVERHRLATLWCGREVVNVSTRAKSWFRVRTMLEFGLLLGLWRA